MKTAYSEYIDPIDIKLEDARAGSHPGPCDEDIDFLREVPYIKEQLNKVDPKQLIKELREYGAWDETELQDHEENLSRFLWIICGHVVEEERERSNHENEI